MNKEALVKSLQEIAGKEHVVFAEEDLVCYAFNARSRRMSTPPVAAVSPATAREVSQILALANEHGVPVMVQGRGSCLADNLTIERPGSLLLSMNRFLKLEIDPDTLTAVVGPGVITHDIKKAAERHGLFYPPDPASFTYCTIGGNVATDAGGLQCVKYGTTKQYVAGLEIVLPDGRIIRTGGKCIKDVAGYNLTQLFVGSEGTLGVVTEIILKLIPLPEGKKAMLVLFDNLENAARAISRIMISGVTPSVMEYMDEVIIDAVEDVAHLGFPSHAQAMLLIEVDGALSTLASQVEIVSDVCNRLGAIEIRVANSSKETENVWMARRICMQALTRKAKGRFSGDPAAPIDKLADCVLKVKDLGLKHSIITACYGHAGDGNMHPCFLFNNDAEKERARQASGEFYEFVVSIGGTVSAEHGIGHEKPHYMHLQFGDAQMDIMKGIKRLIDPMGIMNPGCLFDEARHE